MARRNRKHKFTIYLSDEEKAILEEKVKISEQANQSAFIRNLIVYGYVYDIDYSALRAYSMELARIGNNLNQIAKHANENGITTNNDLKEAKELMEKIWHTHASMLSNQPLVNR